MEDGKLIKNSVAPDPTLEPAPEQTPAPIPQEPAPAPQEPAQAAPLEPEPIPALEPATPKKRGRPRKAPDDKPKNPVGRPRKTPIPPIAEEEPDPHVMLVSALQRHRAELAAFKRQTFAAFMPIRR